MAELFISRIINSIINTCLGYLKDHVLGKRGMQEALESLQKLHPMIQSVVIASSQANIRDRNPSLNIWLWQLRDAVDEADDLLDEYKYLEHSERLNRNILFETAYKIRKVGELLKIDPNLNRLEEVVRKLVNVSAQVNNFLHLLKITEQQKMHHHELYKTLETGSLPKSDLIGRCDEKEFVLQWLTKPSNELHTPIASTYLYKNISLLSIVGHGGMGKTALLQHVYHNETIEKFDLKMWVCISEKFDVKRVIANMLESLKKKKSDFESLDALQESLNSEVISKKFLLVLDDVWDEDESKWENVLAPLANGKFGSRILITTRMKSISLMMSKIINKKVETLLLKGLKENDCLQLLNKHAFANVENFVVHHKLRSIAREMVEKLSGSPFSAKVMGDVLNSSFDERYWIRVLNSDLGSIELGQNDILSIFKISYFYLSKPLQNCFAFCCIFPQGHEFDKDNLVRMWIALDFIQPPSNPRETLEEIGGRYFDLLVKKSFFDQFHNTTYKIYDLLHESVQSISKEECFRVVGDKELSIPETVRHLYIKTNHLEVIKKMGKLKHLRSFILSYENNDINLNDAFANIFESSRSIRLLCIYAPKLTRTPDEIKHLKHLRYMSFCKTSLTRLPVSLSDLYHLQFIIFDGVIESLSNDFLPRNMNNLFNLHYLDLPWNNLFGMHEIRKLISLQKLDNFHIKKEIGYKIEELEHMNELRQLSIYSLENVMEVEEASKVKLSDKRNLMELSLEWSQNRNVINRDLEVNVLDNLLPHNNLKTLKIKSYMGARCAIWMNKTHLISNLEHIELHDCLEWLILPPFGQLPFLKALYLLHMPKVNRLDNEFYGNDKVCVFPSLEVLHITKLEALENWFDEKAAADDRLFPCLIELYIRDCPKLQELPFLPPTLKKLEIHNIRWKALNWKQGSNNRCSTSISIPLETLKVIRCQILTCLPLANGMVRLEALRNLTIKDCPEQISFNAQERQNSEKCQPILNELVINNPSVLLKEPFNSLASIQRLEIMENDELVSIPDATEPWFLKSSLYELRFTNLTSLLSLPSFLKNLSSLKILRLSNISQLQELPTIPTSLERLELDHLESFKCLPSYSSTSLCELYLMNLDKLDCLACLPSFSSLQKIYISNVPLLQNLPDLPLSLCELKLLNLENLDCLPSCISKLDSLKKLEVNLVPQLRNLPELPLSLCELHLVELEKLDSLPSCLPSLSSLQKLELNLLSQLQDLQDVSPFLKHLTIKSCHPELRKRLVRSSSISSKLRLITTGILGFVSRTLIISTPGAHCVQSI